MAKVPIGLQLYSVRHAFTEDPRGTLQKVAGMGYQGVEFYGAPRHTAHALRAMLDETGLAVCGWHTPWALVQEDTIYPTIAYNQVLGNKNVIVPSIPADLRTSRADWQKLAPQFNKVADTLAPHGMVTGYHNHWVEFVEMDGELPWYTLFDATQPNVVMQYDTGNSLPKNIDFDVAGVIKRYPGRAKTVHIKPFSRKLARSEEPMNAFRPIFGEADDDIPWADFFGACESVGGTEWYIVEYESDKYPPLEAVDRSLKALRAMGK
jgi:sugar phosphate isomerase/epimerase